MGGGGGVRRRIDGRSEWRKWTLPNDFRFLFLLTPLTHEDRLDNPAFFFGQMRQIGHGRGNFAAIAARSSCCCGRFVGPLYGRRGRSSHSRCRTQRASAQGSHESLEAKSRPVLRWPFYAGKTMPTHGRRNMDARPPASEAATPTKVALTHRRSWSMISLLK